MAFQIRCPSCNKLYAADERMVGKKIRCRNCNNVFAVQVPTDEPATVPAPTPGAAASGAGMRAHRLEDSIHRVESSDLTGTHRAMDAPEPSDQEKDELLAPGAAKPLLKPSLPHQFPGSLIIEAWLPLGLALISAVWCISTTFSNNTSGKSWIALVRTALVLGLFLLLVAPITYKVVKGQFRQMLRLLPPNPRFRLAATFALPAALGYFFWLNIGSVGGLVTGLILGLVVVAPVFWLLMRLDPQEAATAYAWAGGIFLLMVASSGGILAGGSALLNQAMISAHAVAYHESPLGGPLAWTTPTPPPVRGPKLDLNAGSDQIVSKRPQAATQPAVAAETQAPSVAPATQMAVVSPPLEEVSNSSPKKPADNGLFVNPDEDSFVAGIKQSNLSWVNHVSRPASQSSFDFTLSPVGASSYIGLISTDGQFKFKLGELSSISYAESTRVIPLYESNKDPEVFGTLYALSDDGKALLHLTGSQVQVIPTGGSGSDGAFIPLITPQMQSAQLKPTLLGAIRNSEFVIRWSAPSCEQWVQRYSYVLHKALSSGQIKEEPAALDGAAVSPNLEQQIFYGTLLEMPGKAPQVRVFNLTSASMEPRAGALPASIRSLSDYEHAELAFSPDGKRVALLLEKGDEGRITEFNVGGTSLSLVFSVPCKVPTQVELTGRRGRALQWLGLQYLIVHGQTVISTNANNPGIVGALTSDAVTAEQVTGGNELLLTYTGADSHSHLAVVGINPKQLPKAPAK
jgi:hypothetical protein